MRDNIYNRAKGKRQRKYDNDWGKILIHKLTDNFYMNNSTEAAKQIVLKAVHFKFSVDEAR